MPNESTPQPKSNIPAQWFSGTVQRGDKTGSRYVYPTINLDSSILPSELTRGVYAVRVKIDGQTYQGALYFGPRLVKDEQHDVLEMYVLDYKNDVYGRRVEFILKQFIRTVRDFASLEDLKKQITADIEAVRKALSVS